MSGKIRTNLQRLCRNEFGGRLKNRFQEGRIVSSKGSDTDIKNPHERKTIAGIFEVRRKRVTSKV